MHFVRFVQDVILYHFEDSRAVTAKSCMWHYTSGYDDIKKGVLPRTSLGQAIQYGFNQWPKLDSIVETAKANKLSPYHYLNYLFETLPTINPTDPEQLDQLLPWSSSLQAECRTPPGR